MSEPLNNILIVEDEPLIAEDISETLKEEGYGVCGIAHNADEAIKLFKTSPPCLALLDINLEGHIDGLMLAQLINEDFKIPFIFLTSFTDQSTLDKVKSLKPSGFIVKPFDDKELITNIELAIIRFKEESGQLASMENPVNDSLFLKHNGSLVKVLASHILYAEAFDNYCFIHTNKEKYLLPHTLKSVGQKLDSKIFVRTHRSFVINLNAIEVINEDHLVINGTCLPISRSLRPDLLSKISLL